MDAILTPVSIGELIDKITILQIKAERIDDAAKLANVRTELDGLLPLLQQQLQAQPALAALQDKSLIWREKRGVYALEEAGTASVMRRAGLLDGAA